VETRFKIYSFRAHQHSLCVIKVTFNVANVSPAVNPTLFNNKGTISFAKVTN